jgi:glutamine cyclotransferase
MQEGEPVLALDRGPGGLPGSRLYQELWQTGKLYTYSVADFEQVQSVQGPLQDGWGATTNNKSLILSDGSASLAFVDPATLTVQRTLQVRQNRPLRDAALGHCITCGARQPC